MDSTAVRAHQHVAGARRAPPAGGCSRRGLAGAEPGHWRGQSVGMDRLAGYDDVACEVVKEVEHQMGIVVSPRVAPSQVIVDPGLGFAKTRENDWTLLARIDAWAQLGRPVLVTASRKRFLGTLRADRDTGEPPSGPRPRCCHHGGIAAGRRPGPWAVRAHEVSATADAVRVEAALRRR
ncbi:dihydropteroate synthase [Streptomyces mirabilis]|uniref:dihydropteroate synthase n=1 Tax=Streptomyces mirabilis TaxID=68239 RepID=UPI0033AF4A89